MNHNPQTISMCSHGMFCGAGSIKRMAEDDNGCDDQPCKTLSRALSASSASPKGPKRKAGKNPYSGRGLDKFSSVLSELEARREKIMASARPQSVALVRFMHSNSHDWVPIVVRLRDPPTKENQHPASTNMRLAADSQPPARQLPEAPKEARGATAQKAVKKSFSWGSDNNRNNNKRRGYNWVVVMVIILACLMVFGRVFAICCTSIWWYLVPTLKGEEEGQNRRSMKTKDYGRRVSAKGINTSSNNNNNNALTSPRSAHATHGKRG
ncbi:uncharacterized protein LOC109718294 [Ananas comosus]|uniref:Uncharacterized protein LOC109718294 n=1 Tax=Ananas comosus TaxID=4615 RepID=A0A6P5FVQ5_ANACO|nr:uncharacterized protein LOC109718294 [Ananas comosus]